MDKISLLLQTIINLSYVLIPVWIGYLLGKSRDKNNLIFNKKLKIYSDISSHINSSRDLRLNINISIDKLKTLCKEIESLQEKNRNENNKFYLEKEIKKELEEVNFEIKKLDYKLGYTDNLIKLLAPARLLGSELVVSELREYYSLISEFYSLEESKENTDFVRKKISKSVMELEQLMRKDLGNTRLLFKKDIWFHIFHKK